MPDILLIILITVSIPCLIGALVEGHKELFLVFLFCLLSCCVWGIVYLKTPYEYNSYTTTISTINNIDVFEIDGCLYNANRFFSRDFEDNQTIVLKRPKDQTYKWIYPTVPSMREWSLSDVSAESTTSP